MSLFWSVTQPFWHHLVMSSHRPTTPAATRDPAPPTPYSHRMVQPHRFNRSSGGMRCATVLVFRRRVLSPAEKGVMHPPFPPPHTFLCGTRFLGVFGSDSLALTSSGGCSGCSQKNFSTCVLLSNFDSTEKTRTQTNHLPSHASYIDKSTSP